MVIRVFAEDGPCSVNLFKQENPGQFMRQGGQTETQKDPALFFDGFAQPIGTAKNKTGGLDRILKPVLEALGKLRGGVLCSPAVKCDDKIPGLEGFEDGLLFGFPFFRGGEIRRPVFQGDGPNGVKAGYLFQILIHSHLPVLFFQLSNPDAFDFVAHTD